ncbi:ABC transporter permease [Saccharicrinis fermentans]|uniref:Lipoprotein-releasing system transmembrane protein LolE n=1 Tax=Saccharicrinis fermentans DSM 9555 = JCM 21142 TaxID=869213 RepID=W7Y4R3_9BACT|nr:ABC transporter permease [Saccharicrinis fermentans]GAF03067.1 lipoprotein-releasing system transmembrane protein LolE [Saccharicrinis fermentans DSM 9555 = JCM 21142]
MNLNLYIANKIRKGEITGKKLSGPIITVATIGIVLGITVMILSLSIGTGFKREIRNKIIGFGAHIQIVNYDYNSSYETNPIERDSAFVNQVLKIPGVKNVQEFATKPGLLKTKENIQGVIIKGIGKDFNWDYFDQIIVEGQKPDVTQEKTSNDIIISRTLARLLKLKIGDKVPTYFFQDRIRPRNFRISAIYDSSLPEFDKVFLFVDIRHIIKLNKWNDNQVTGYEVTLNEFDDIPELSSQIDLLAASKISPDGGLLRTTTIIQQQPQIFGWLNLLDTNVAVILILIVLVAGFNMISGLLIIILERTAMIGILKALGKQNHNIRKVFIYLATFIIAKGVLIGNFIGISICLLQKYFGIISLDPENYYLNTVPIHLNLLHILYLNMGTIVVSYLMMIAPSYLATKITPVEAIRFD